MALVHSKETVVQLDGNDLSAFANASEIAKTAQDHDTTVYGRDSERHSGGLLGGTASISGFYDDDGTDDPRTVINPLVGSTVELIRQPEGTGSGLPQDVVDVLVQTYTESDPVAGYKAWSVSLVISGDVDDTAQSA